MRARESERDQGAAQNEQRPWNETERGLEGPGLAQNELDAEHAHQGQAQQASQRQGQLEGRAQRQEQLATLLEAHEQEGGLQAQEEPGQEPQQAQVHPQADSPPQLEAAGLLLGPRAAQARHRGQRAHQQVPGAGGSGWQAQRTSSSTQAGRVRQRQHAPR